MNYYERIQKALDYIEENLTEPIALDELARKAEMSLTIFYRLFYSIVGYTVKDFVRRRRFSFASMMLANTDKRIIDISLDCQFESQEAFTRAFKQQLGYTPNFCRTNNILYNFKRMDLMDTYFVVQDNDLNQRYPDIKVLKRLDPMKVAYYSAYSRTPENDASTVLQEWANRNKLLGVDSKYRLFGFDASDAKPGDDIYGYEVWMTMDNDFEVQDEKVKSKLVDGGMYAVTSTCIKDIEATWNRFREWLKMSKYGLGKHQYLEEHLPFNEWGNDNPQGEYNVDLYMPITIKEDKTSERILPVHVAYTRIYGLENKAPFEAWGTILEWAQKNNLFNGSQPHRFYACHNYNSEKEPDKQWYEVMVTVSKNTDFAYEKINLKIFSGGDYITSISNRNGLAKAWKEMLRWQGITKTKSGDHQWVEEWFVKDGVISSETEIRIFLPIQK